MSRTFVSSRHAEDVSRSTTPMPSEVESNLMENAAKVRQNENDTSCTIKIKYSINAADGKPFREPDEATIYFKSDLPPYKVFAGMTELMKERLKDEHIADVSFECGFCGKGRAPCS